MGVLRFNSSQCCLPSTPSSLTTSNNYTQASSLNLTHIKSSGGGGSSYACSAARRIVTTRTATDSPVETADAGAAEDVPPCVNFAFVHSVLLPDGTPDVHFRTACGGQKLRNIMIDNDIELYGPYSRPLLNCAGGGTCGTCIVEIVEGKQLLSLKTDCEKEKLKKKPKTWRLACQATVGTADSTGLLVVQQLPEWKGHTWGREKVTDGEE
uniref:2Fe-2S ferredoxin-type domain-containing protein n=1 Tax=Kalanchoe fedtschenkoi TaxID=63787 RepID=A0A7N0RHB3_KALFE